MIRRPRSERFGRSALTPVVVVVMIGLAGCAGTGLGLPTGAPAPYTDTGAALDGDDLRETHLTELEAAGSYRSSFKLVVSGAARSARVNRSVVVDLPANASTTETVVNAESIEGDGVSVATYTTGNVTYRQFVVDVGQQTLTRYDAARAPYSDGPLAVQPVDTEEAAHGELIEPLVDDINWTQRGVDRYDGGWVTRYEARGVENFSRLGEAAVDVGRVESDRAEWSAYRGLRVSTVNATMFVGPDGVVRRFRVRVAGDIGGQPVDLALSGTTGEAGSAAVKAPGWLEAAKDNAAMT